MTCKNIELLLNVRRVFIKEDATVYQPVALLL
jgi:hypothetical protein